MSEIRKIDFVQTIGITLSPGYQGEPVAIVLHGDRDILHEVDLSMLVGEMIGLLDGPEYPEAPVQLADAAIQMRALADKVDAALAAYYTSGTSPRAPI